MRIALAVILTLCLSPAFGQSSGANLKGQVLDSNGAVIGLQSHPHVEIRNHDSLRVTGNLPPTIDIDTDAAGKYAVELRPGIYDVCISAERFAPNCTQLEIKDWVSISYSPRLKVAVESLDCPRYQEVSLPLIQMPLADLIELKKLPVAVKLRQVSR